MRLVLLVAAFSLGTIARAEDRAPQPALALRVSVNRASSPLYDQVFFDGSIHFAAELTNRSGRDLRIDDDFDDDVHFTLRCDGREIVPKWVYASPIVSQIPLPSSRVLKPGQSVSFSIPHVASTDRQHPNGFTWYQPIAGVCVIRFTYYTAGLAPVQSNNVVFELLAPGEKSRILPPHR